MPDASIETVLRIYDTVADPSLWPEVLDRLADTVDAKGCLVFEVAEQSLHTTLHSSFYVPDMLAAYNEKFRYEEMADQKAFADRAIAHDSIDIISDELLYDDLQTFKTRPNVSHVMQLGILHRAAALLNKDNQSLSRFSVQFSTRRGPITHDEVATLNQYLPHIAKALDLGRPSMELARAQRGLLAAMDQLTIGVCVLDAAGRLVANNDEFQRQSEDHDVFTTANGVLTFASAEHERRFRALKAEVLNHGHFGARPRKEAITSGSDSALCVELVPLMKAEEIGTRPLDGFALYSTDTSRAFSCNFRSMKSVYGLTDTEVELVAAVAEGLTNMQIAERRARSVATVNSQVKSILSKTQSSTRTQLVRLMMSFGTSCLK
ncbi:MAG: helix-turn-helix transcriptional regulator [Pseudomonadota bacterium]